MVEGQDTIWYLSNKYQFSNKLEHYPFWKGLKSAIGKPGVLFTDAVDEWVTMTLNEYQETPVKSGRQGEFDEEEDAETQEAKDKANPC